MKRIAPALLLLVLTACGAGEPVIKTQVHLAKGMDFETLLEGTSELEAGRLEQAIKDKPMPMDLQVVVTRDGEGEDFAQQTLTFHAFEREGQNVLTFDSPSGVRELAAEATSAGVEPFLKIAAREIAAVAGAERRRLMRP